ncbi:Flp family type IVb pilin [Tepidicaulis sp. LMO-SS28]|uniref:Flp family type IVb pilin n=1 Tax=Tepidicaulis sp. LMO-SS28 TaxID=3447455 RepID=UPI003EE1EC7E
MSQFMTKFFKDESGATAIEYGLIAAGVAVAIAAAIPTLQDLLTSAFDKVQGAIDG